MKKIILVVSLLSFYVFGFGQGNHSVDYSTGTLSVGMPLFAIQSGSVSVPVSLSYTANGVKVTDEDGWLGHGWSVSADHFRISREVRGLPDEYSSTTDSRKGWLHDNNTFRTSIQTQTFTSDNNVSICTDEVADYNFLNTIGYDIDTEPDVFYVNAPGLSFQFYFDENKEARVVPYQDVIVTRNPATNTFTVKNDQGVEYEFFEQETLTEALFAASSYYFLRKSNQYQTAITFTTSWRLTKVVSPIYGTVNLTYRTITTDDDNLVSVAGGYRDLRKFRYPLITGNMWMPGYTLQYARASTMKILDHISSSTEEAHFVSAPKFTGSIIERLNSVELYDKREGTLTLVKEFPLTYVLHGTQQRAFLSSVKEQTAANELMHTFEYNMPGILPAYGASDIDEWEFFKLPNPEASYQYDETASAGSLRRINYPLKGYSVFFYETNWFREGGVNIQGAGIRIKKIISHDGVSSANDFEQDFEYTDGSGNSSGKMTYRARKQFSVAMHLQLSGYTQVQGKVRWRDVDVASPGLTDSEVNERFTVTADRDIAIPEPMRGSYVAYSRVTVKTKDAGYSVYEYDNPALEGDNTANSNEWQRSKVFIARPFISAGVCAAAPNMPGGYNQYPFPPNPNYEFAQGLLTKVTDFRADGIKVRDVVYTYQRIYGGSAIRKIYGLALEELPTYSWNGSYSDHKMFLFSKYEINTEVKTELLKTTETVYHNSTLSKKTELITDFFYTGSNHRYLTRVESVNSDGIKSISRYRYVKDYSNITSPTATEATALKNLNTAHRVGERVESTASKMIGGTEKFVSAALTTYKTLSGLNLPGKVLPYKTYSFTAASGDDSFTLSSSTTSSFTYAQSKYVPDNTFDSYDAYGNVNQVTGRNMDVSSVVYGYGGTLPVLEMSHAKLGDMRYSNFDANGVSLGDGFFPTWSHTTCPGRNGSLGINLPAGSASANYFTGGLTGTKSPFTIFSFWAKSSGNATVTLEIGSITSSISVTPSADWKYYSVKSNFESILGFPTSYPFRVWSSALIKIDDMAIYPEMVDFVSNTYDIPFGKTAETDSRGDTMSYEYDDLGRLKVVYDRDKNILKTYDYQIKP